MSTPIDVWLPRSYAVSMNGKEKLRDTLEDTLRRRRNPSLRELAEEVGVSHGTLSNIRNMKKVPATDTLQKLAPVFRTDIDTLLIWAGHKPEPQNEEAPAALANLGGKFRDLAPDELKSVEDFAEFVRSQRDKR